jgi:hypothetical protein
MNGFKHMDAASTLYFNFAQKFHKGFEMNKKHQILQYEDNVIR